MFTLKLNHHWLEGGTSSQTGFATAEFIWGVLSDSNRGLTLSSRRCTSSCDSWQLFFQVATISLSSKSKYDKISLTIIEHMC